MKRKLSNEILIYIFLGIELILLCIVSFVSPKQFINFINKRIINCQYSCEKGWSLKEDKCYKEESIKYVQSNIIGDLNNSGSLDNNDLDILKKYLANPYKLKDNEFILYDVSDDGKINNIDYKLLINLINNNQLKHICPVTEVIIDSQEKIIISYNLVGFVCQIKKVVEKPPISTCNDVSTTKDLY